MAVPVNPQGSHFCQPGTHLPDEQTPGYPAYSRMKVGFDAPGPDDALKFSRGIFRSARANKLLVWKSPQTSLSHMRSSVHEERGSPGRRELQAGGGATDLLLVARQRKFADGN